LFVYVDKSSGGSFNIVKTDEISDKCLKEDLMSLIGILGTLHVVEKETPLDRGVVKRAFAAYQKWKTSAGHMIVNMVDAKMTEAKNVFNKTKNLPPEPFFEKLLEVATLVSIMNVFTGGYHFNNPDMKKSARKSLEMWRNNAHPDVLAEFELALPAATDEAEDAWWVSIGGFVGAV
jgi:hypothetical protein